MKFIKNFFEKTEPYVQKGAKYHWLRSVHDGFYTFLYVPNKTAKGGTHIHDYIDLKRAMSIVVLALVPAFFLECTTPAINILKQLANWHQPIFSKFSFSD